ncbi:MAG: hypothetical protein IJ446_09070 [Oscillospiraceae bacterium]|nr:hypothetical protein [Oscillospiraceae bacterium]
MKKMREKLMWLFGRITGDAERLIANGAVDYLLEKGVVVLPARVGGTLYIVHKENDVGQMIEEAKIQEVSTHRIWTANGNCYSHDEIDKTVFLNGYAAMQYVDYILMNVREDKE